MKTRKSFLGRHGIIDGVFVVIVLCHLMVVSQCQRPISNVTQQQLELNADVNQFASYSYDNNVHSDHHNIMGLSGGGDDVGSDDDGTGGTADGNDNGVIDDIGNYGTGGYDAGGRVTTTNIGGRRKHHPGLGVGHGTNPKPQFDINYSLLQTQNAQQLPSPHRERKLTFQDLRKNLKEQRKQWDRQGDEPEPAANQNLMKILKSKILKSDVSKRCSFLLLLALSIRWGRLSLWCHWYVNEYQ